MEKVVSAIVLLRALARAGYITAHAALTVALYRVRFHALPPVGIVCRNVWHTSHPQGGGLGVLCVPLFSSVHILVPVHIPGGMGHLPTT
jgi:hypothetical protein